MGPFRRRSSRSQPLECLEKEPSWTLARQKSLFKVKCFHGCLSDLRRRNPASDCEKKGKYVILRPKMSRARSHFMMAKLGRSLGAAARAVSLTRASLSSSFSSHEQRRSHEGHRSCDEHSSREENCSYERKYRSRNCKAEQNLKSQSKTKLDTLKVAKATCKRYTARFETGKHYRTTQHRLVLILVCRSRSFRRSLRC